MIKERQVDGIRELTLEEIAEVSGGLSQMLNLCSIERSICSFVNQILSCFCRSSSG